MFEWALLFMFLVGGVFALALLGLMVWDLAKDIFG